MKAVHNILMAYQWSLMIAGALAAAPLGYFVGIPEALLSLVVSLLALAALKLEVLAFAR